jgi:hypothetical protein
MRAAACGHAHWLTVALTSKRMPCKIRGALPSAFLLRSLAEGDAQIERQGFRKSGLEG